MQSAQMASVGAQSKSSMKRVSVDKMLLFREKKKIMLQVSRR